MIQDLRIMEKIVSLCKRRGFVYPGSEIYGGFAGTYDYGHYGVLLKDHLKEAWIKSMREEDNIALIDSSIFSSRATNSVYPRSNRWTALTTFRARPPAHRNSCSDSLTAAVSLRI
mgnify:CR=1 FL=1